MKAKIRADIYSTLYHCIQLNIIGCYIGIFGFEVLTAVPMKSSIFWDIMPCSLMKVNWLFGETCHFHPQCGAISQARNQHEAGRRQSCTMWHCILEGRSFQFKICFVFCYFEVHCIYNLKHCSWCFVLTIKIRIKERTLQQSWPFESRNVSYQQYVHFNPYLSLYALNWYVLFFIAYFSETPIQFKFDCNCPHE
jgi:hypothetical protein